MSITDSRAYLKFEQLGRDGDDRLDRPSSDARLVRRELVRQIGFLERRLNQHLADSFGRVELPLQAKGRSRGPRIIPTSELEAIRDELVDRAAENEQVLGKRDRYEQAKKRELEEMLADPSQFKGVKISQAELGLRGCGAWEVRPRLGLIGMMMNWWRVVLSSGCP